MARAACPNLPDQLAACDRSGILERLVAGLCSRLVRSSAHKAGDKAFQDAAAVTRRQVDQEGFWRRSGHVINEAPMRSKLRTRRSPSSSGTGRSGPVLDFHASDTRVACGYSNTTMPKPREVQDSRRQQHRVGGPLHEEHEVHEFCRDRARSDSRRGTPLARKSRWRMPLAMEKAWPPAWPKGGIEGVFDGLWRTGGPFGRGDRRGIRSATNLWKHRSFDGFRGRE